MIQKGFSLKIAIIGLILILSYVNSDSLSSTVFLLNVSSKSYSDSHIQYTSHPSIIIDGNIEFNDTAITEGWNGNGSQSNPYIIDGLEITGIGTGALVEIKNTDVHFILSNNRLIGNSETIDIIVLRIVSNGSIINNLVENCQFSGIRLFRSTKNEISGNTFMNCGKAPRSTTQYWPDISGIYLHLSDANNITDNECKKNHVFGISLSRSSNNFVSRNNLSQQFYGIGILDVSIHNVISENSIVGNTHAGLSFYFVTAVYNIITKNIFHSNAEALWVSGRNNLISFNVFHDNPVAITLGIDIPGDPWYASRNNVTNNLIYNNSQGIFLQYATEINIFNNSIFTNTNHGLGISSASSDNTIKWNDFIKNNHGGRSQATDDGTNNEFISNYWWTSSTKAYSIAGEANNADSSPLTSVINSDSPEIPESKASSGWSIFLVLSVIFTYRIFRKTKKK